MFSDDKQCISEKSVFGLFSIVLNIVLLQESIAYKDYYFCDGVADTNEVLATAKKFLTYSSLAYQKNLKGLSFFFFCFK